MLTLFALAPIVAILVLMIGLRWSGARAGVAGFLLALLIALSVFGFGTTVQPRLGVAGATAGVLLEAAFIAATILWIIFPALCIHHLQVRAGGMRVLRDALASLSPDPRIMAILVAWFFALFAEGAAGFGTPVALAAPFLVGLGFDRVRAVTVALLGHCVGVSFGAVGTPVVPQIAVTGMTGVRIAAVTALPHLLFGGVMLYFLMRETTRLDTLRENAWRGMLPWLLAAAALFLVPFYIIARWVGPELPTLAGAILGGGAFVAVLMLRRQPTAEPSGERAGWSRMITAGAPYLVLVGLILITRLIEPVESALRAVTVRWSVLEAFSGSVQPLFHPGTALLLGFLAGAAVQRASVRETGSAALAAVRQLGTVTVALVAMLALARTMVHAGMIDVLAESAATYAGAVWPVLVPAVGALGTFITGSATASNILLTDFQVATAKRLELALLPLVGGQGFGAAVGNIVCPHNVIAGGATVGLSGREGEVIRRTLVPCIIYALLGGAFIYWMVVWR